MDIKSAEFAFTAVDEADIRDIPDNIRKKLTLIPPRQDIGRRAEPRASDKKVEQVANSLNAASLEEAAFLLHGMYTSVA